MVVYVNLWGTRERHQRYKNILFSRHTQTVDNLFIRIQRVHQGTTFLKPNHIVIEKYIEMSVEIPLVRLRINMNEISAIGAIIWVIGGDMNSSSGLSSHVFFNQNLFIFPDAIFEILVLVLANT